MTTSIYGFLASTQPKPLCLRWFERFAIQTPR
jgi:hypothetical protein